MRTNIHERRTTWRSLSRQDKQERLESMRRRQQSQVQIEMLRLHHHIR
jgi:hypothetical protein